MEGIDVQADVQAEANGGDEIDRLQQMEDTLNEEKKKMKDPLYCHLCDVQCPTAQALVNHSRSVIHTEKAEEEMRRRNEQESTGITQEAKKKVHPTEPAEAKIRCELCDCECSGDVSYQAHLVGARHQKNVRNKELGVPLKQGPSKKGKTTGVVGINNSSAKTVDDVKVQPLLDSVTEPLIGLQYVTEFRDEDPSKEIQYVCSLCEVSFNSGNLVSHVMGIKHRYQYLKEHYVNYYTTIRQKQCKKSELTPIVDEYARAVEAEEGRQKLTAKVNINTGYKQNQEKRVGPLMNNQPGAKRGRMDYGGSGWGGGYGGGWGSMGAGAGFGRGRSGMGGRGGFGWNDFGDGGFTNRMSFKRLLFEINNAEISTEEDAALALQVSNSLTQKLLEYRLENVPRHKEHVVSEIMGENWRGQMSRVRGRGRGRGLFRGGYSRGGGGNYGNNGSNSYGYSSGDGSMQQNYDPWKHIDDFDPSNEGLNNRFDSEQEFCTDDIF